MTETIDPCLDEFTITPGMVLKCEQPKDHDSVHTKLTRNYEGQLMRVSW